MAFGASSINIGERDVRDGKQKASKPAKDLSVRSGVARDDLVLLVITRWCCVWTVLWRVTVSAGLLRCTLFQRTLPARHWVASKAYNDAYAWSNRETRCNDYLLQGGYDFTFVCSSAVAAERGAREGGRPGRHFAGGVIWGAKFRIWNFEVTPSIATC